MPTVKHILRISGTTDDLQNGAVGTLLRPNQIGVSNDTGTPTTSADTPALVFRSTSADFGECLNKRTIRTLDDTNGAIRTNIGKRTTVSGDAEMDSFGFITVCDSISAFGTSAELDILYVPLADYKMFLGTIDISVLVTQYNTVSENNHTESRTARIGVYVDGEGTGDLTIQTLSLNSAVSYGGQYGAGFMEESMICVSTPDAIIDNCLNVVADHTEFEANGSSPKIKLINAIHDTGDYEDTVVRVSYIANVSLVKVPTYVA